MNCSVYSDNQTHSTKIWIISMSNENYSGWPLSRYSEIPWHFPDNSLTMCGTHAHVKWYSYHACTTSVNV